MWSLHVNVHYTSVFSVFFSNFHSFTARIFFVIVVLITVRAIFSNTRTWTIIRLNYIYIFHCFVDAFLFLLEIGSINWKNHGSSYKRNAYIGIQTHIPQNKQPNAVKKENDKNTTARRRLQPTMADVLPPPALDQFSIVCVRVLCWCLCPLFFVFSSFSLIFLFNIFSIFSRNWMHMCMFFYVFELSLFENEVDGLETVKKFTLVQECWENIKAKY